jgi:hypothetical protein
MTHFRMPSIIDRSPSASIVHLRSYGYFRTTPWRTLASMFSMCFGLLGCGSSLPDNTHACDKDDGGCGESALALSGTEHGAANSGPKCLENTDRAATPMTCPTVERNQEAMLMPFENELNRGIRAGRLDLPTLLDRSLEFQHGAAQTSAPEAYERLKKCAPDLQLTPGQRHALNATLQAYLGPDIEQMTSASREELVAARLNLMGELLPALNQDQRSALAAYMSNDASALFMSASPTIRPALCCLFRVACCF